MTFKKSACATSHHFRPQPPFLVVFVESGRLPHSSNYVSFVRLDLRLRFAVPDIESDDQKISESEANSKRKVQSKPEPKVAFKFSNF